MSFANQHGIGESYRVLAQIRLLALLAREHRIRLINEFPSEPISQSFPGLLNWLPVSSPRASKADMMFCWRAFPEVARRIVAEFPGNFILLMGTNRLNPGVIFQRLFWKEREHYAGIQDLTGQLQCLGLEVVDTGFYDSPPWFDAPLPLNLHLGIDMKPSRMLELWENLGARVVRAHHVWALGRRAHV